MNRRYLFDTNSLSSLTKSHDTHHEKLVSMVAALNDDVELYASIVSLYEMEYGACHAKEPELIQAAKEAIQYNILKMQMKTKKKMGLNFII